MERLRTRGRRRWREWNDLGQTILIRGNRECRELWNGPREHGDRFLASLDCNCHFDIERMMRSTPAVVPP